MQSGKRSLENDGTIYGNRIRVSILCSLLEGEHLTPKEIKQRIGYEWGAFEYHLHQLVLKEVVREEGDDKRLHTYSIRSQREVKDNLKPYFSKIVESYFEKMPMPFEELAIEMDLAQDNLHAGAVSQD